MATNTLPQRLQINGLIDTNQDVVSNMEKICRNATSWMSYDTANGKWAVVINKAGTSVHSFNDSNIVGPISVTGRDLTELYNRCVVKYPLRDTADKTDTIVLEIPAGERSAYETDKTLEITLDMVNEPVQAQLLGLIELKQSRVDTIVQFTGDYSTINVEAGDIIDITNTYHGWTNKLFRVVSVIEAEGDEGALAVQYQCLEYDPAVYDETALSRYIRTDRTNIKSLGVIGQPSAPVISVLEVDAVPNHAVEIEVPTGIVEEIEIWKSFDNTNWEYDVTIVKVDETATFTPGNTHTITRPYTVIPREWALGSSGPTGSYTVYWKTRGVNSVNTGPFSPIGSATWNPVFSAEGAFTGAQLVTDTGSIPTNPTTSSSYTVGETVGITQAQLGSTSASNYATASGVTLPTKDSGAPSYESVNIYRLSNLNLTTMNTELASVCGTATLSGYVPTVPGDTEYLSVSFTTTYGAYYIDVNWQLPFGEYDFQYLDVGASPPATAIFQNVLGYVPTQLELYFTPQGSGTEYAIKGVVTNTANGFANFGVSLADLTAAGVPSANFVGTFRFSLNVTAGDAPTPVAISSIGTYIYPYNWDVTAYSGLQPSGYITVYQQ